MTITNPGAIPNSGAVQFSNQIGAIALINYNRIVDANDYNAFENYIWYSNHLGVKVRKCGKKSDKKHSKQSSSCKCSKQKKH
jgi:hypothetical protein